MHKQSSYLDSLNEGRKRRPRTSIEDLDRTLRGLEERIGRVREGGHPSGRHQGYDDGRGWYGEDRASAFDPVNPPSRSHAHEIEFARLQEKNVVAVETIAAELRKLRSELNQRMASDLHAEFESLRSDARKAYEAARSGNAGASLRPEIERLSENVQALARRTDDSGIAMLRVELDQIRRAIGTLAREDTLQKFNERYDDLSRRREGAGIGGPVADPELGVLVSRLEQIDEAIKRLPESFSLESLEEKLRTLALSVEQFARIQGDGTPEYVSMIDRRLDEISRAIVASSVSIQSAVPGADSFERIEGRISALAQQLDELSESQLSSQLIERLSALTERFDSITDHLAPPAMDDLADKIDALSRKIETGAPGAISDDRLRDLEARLDAIAGFLAESGAPSGAGSDAIIDAIDERFREIARHLEGRPASVQDTDLLRSLESQIADLNQHLSRPESVHGDDAGIEPRIRDLELSAVQSREQIIEAAREAAEMTIRSLPALGADNPAVEALAEELRILEELTRRSDERNSKTFEAIHDTLLKIVDRLGALEGFRSEHAPIGGDRRFSADRTPSLQSDDGFAFEDDQENVAEAGSRRQRSSLSPAEAAASAARFAVSGDGDDADAVDEELLRPGPARFRRSDTPAANATEAGIDAGIDHDAPAREPERDNATFVDPIDPEEDDTPLEPGSGAPDLDAIMSRIRNERGDKAPAGQEEAGNSDFIAAARRAAKAAAAEANHRGAPSAKRQQKTGGMRGALLTRGRKPLLVAAAILIIALAGFQLGKAFLGGKPADVAGTVPTAPGGQGDTGAPTPSPMSADEEVAEVRVIDPVGTAATDGGDRETGNATVAEMHETDTASAAPSPEAPVEEIQVETAEVAEIGEVPLEAGPVALREAAEARDPRALFEIGSRYAEGRGVDVSLDDAVRWFRHSAELGFPPAQYRLGNLYEKGLGVERDPAAAMTWYQLAAEQGSASAMHNLAVLYAMGANGRPDNEAAARWFLEAAELGVRDSQYNLGILAAKGVGMEQDLEASYKWFALAANSGDKDAASKRDEIANALRPEQLTRARAAVELWRARPVDPEANDVEIPGAWQEDHGKTASIDMKQAVTNIQLILARKGYDPGPADGVLGEKTRNAIARFQAENGMTATGEVDEVLVRALLAKD